MNKDRTNETEAPDKREAERRSGAPVHEPIQPEDPRPGEIQPSAPEIEPGQPVHDPNNPLTPRA